ncbi:MAG: radical SAM family heme chaperone HemW [Acidobacteria bacterium]|nr:radical SAM family heme chaperone HemW [Acidobacteriota bacterium]MCA1627193.1 radical SAM family heme chaperone HemW [Acidobacteriota bacterium]
MSSTGLYIHIPFCRSRCSYCDFATGLYDAELANRYVSAVVNEINSSSVAGAHVDTIYFGGGTPSLLEPAQLDRILSALRDRFDVAPDSEITLEINPGSVNEAKLSGFRQLGINRASFGAQTFDDRELAKLGRSHTAADARRTFHDLRAAGFDNVSFDLIAGLPGQTFDGWQRNVDEALALAPEHLSFYLLEVHSGTRLAQHIQRGLQPEPDEDLAAVMYEWMLGRASEAGYEHYEISNLCRPGFESRHNTKYWTGEPYFGFGCSAHSYDGESRRWSNERDALKYVELIERASSPIIEKQFLTDRDVKAENLFLGLRLMRGVSRDLCKDYETDLERFREAGLLELDGDCVRLTRSGALLSNEVFSAFV